MRLILYLRLLCGFTRVRIKHYQFFLCGSPLKMRHLKLIYMSFSILAIVQNCELNLSKMSDQPQVAILGATSLKFNFFLIWTLRGFSTQNNLFTKLQVYFQWLYLKKFRQNNLRKNAYRSKSRKTIISAKQLIFYW